MTKLKARFLRWLFLINPVHIFQGWRAYDVSLPIYGITTISAVIPDTSCRNCFKQEKVFWRIPDHELPSVEDVQAIYREAKTPEYQAKVRAEQERYGKKTT